MYRSEGRKSLVFSSGVSSGRLSTRTSCQPRAVVTYSAGKDSMWNMWWTQQEYGLENVAPLHISGLNRNNAAQEREFAQKQASCFGFQNFSIVDLLNSSRNTGYQTMRSRDIFLAGIAIPVAVQFGAQKVIIEGFAETDIDREFFSGRPDNIEYFNTLLYRLGISVQVSWRNRAEMDIVKDIFENKPEWMPYVCNCFSSPCYLPSRRDYWRKKAPSINFYDSQCGSCVKCRIIVLGRILYDLAFKARREDIIFFLLNTNEWMKTNRAKLKDMIEGSFTRDFRTACERYGITPKPVA